MASISPFSLDGRWLKAGLHTHTTQSDGRRTPEEAVAFYQEEGYDLLAITDHWVYTSGDGLGGDGLHMLPGVELHGPGYHMLALGLCALPDRALADIPSALAEEVGRLGGLAYIAHPYWTGQTSAEIAAVSGIEGIEVYNAVCDVTRGLGYSRVHWDELLGTGHRLTGLAVDDVHWAHGPGAEGRGYVMVRAEEPSVPAVLEALRAGAFYSTTGPRILDLAVERNSAGEPILRLRCTPCQDVTFHALGPRGQRFSAPEGGAIEEAELPIREEQVYLRVECHQSPLYTGNGRSGVAWSNPVYVPEVLALLEQARPGTGGKEP